LRSAGWRGVEVVCETINERGLVWQSESGARILLTHGDLFNAPRAYLAFRTLIKAKPTLMAASFVPGMMMDAYALQHAKASRARDPYRTLDDAAILGDARAFARSKNVDHLIFGHFHRPWAVPINGGNQDQLVMCMDSWDVPNALIYDGKSFHRAFLGDNAHVVAVTPAKSGVQS
jgi:UDP-2,3-diacylglucosamine pyrophosphatase LpxH